MYGKETQLMGFYFEVDLETLTEIKTEQEVKQE